MQDELSILDEDWRKALGKLVSAVRSDALDGDVQRLRIKRELAVTLGQCKRVRDASNELRSSMDRLYEFMDEEDSRHVSSKTKGLRR